MPASTRGPGWSTSERPLHEQHDVLLLDLDGVVYVGDAVVARAAPALAAAVAAGARLAFVTNNASRTPDAVAEHLTRIGVAADVDDVVTSAQAAATVLAGRLAPGSRVLVVGGEGLRAALTAVGLVPVASADDDPAAVVQGFSPDIGWAQLVEGCLAVRAGVAWVATNLDLSIPTPRGPAPGNGALVQVVQQATGATPTVTGKPWRPIMDEAVRRTGARRPLVVGDRLDTDIAGAAAAELPSLLVLTGVSAARDLLAAPAGLRPTLLAADLDGLAAPHPGCAAGPDGWWRCDGTAARVVGHLVELDPASPATESADEALAALRAACSAVWAVAGAEGADEHLVAEAARALSAWTAQHGWDR
ncbi:MAG: HAD-IIA family hydrolase [Actinomycetota bacterium]